MKTVRQLLHDKPQQALYPIGPEATVYQALQRMAEADLGALLVMEGDRLVGLITERDYARKVILRGKASTSTLVREVMVARVPYVKPTQTLDQCMATMSELRVRHLPVMEGNEVLGVLSISDLVREKVADQQFTIEQLEHYIHGWTPASSDVG